ncbi:MAG TPA: fasciclin domain-containing protein, partial [Rhodothermales bacterium]|nr:fasciclin domain-containing protein [Rhodothermales bacterium]
MRLPRLALIPLLLVATGCGLSDADQVRGDAAAVITSVDALNTFEAAAEATGLLPELAGPGPYTVFAPNELAFAYLGEARDRLLDPAVRRLLVRVLRHHVVPGDVSPDDLTDGATLQTLDGTPLHVRRFGGRIYVGEAQVDTVPRGATNGRVYEVRSVLREHLSTVDRLRLSPTADSFLDLLDDAGLLPSLGGDAAPFTLFVPVEDGFHRLGADVIALLNTPANADIRGLLARYHVVPGRVDVLQDGATLQTLSGRTLSVRNDGGNVPTFVGGERVMAPPIETPDGVIYLVARPLLGDLTLDERLRIEPTLATFNALIRRVPAANAEVTSAGPYTLFAPPSSAYDDAFPFDTRVALLTPE